MIGWRTFVCVWVCGWTFANTRILIRIELIWPSLWLLPLDHPSDHLGHLSVPEHQKLWLVPAWSYAQDSLEAQGVFSSLPAIPSIPGLWLCLSGHLCSALLPPSIPWIAVAAGSVGDFQIVEALAAQSHVCPKPWLPLFWWGRQHTFRSLILVPPVTHHGVWPPLLRSEFSGWRQIRVSKDLVACPGCLSPFTSQSLIWTQIPAWCRYKLKSTIPFEMQIHFAQIPPHLQWERIRSSLEQSGGCGFRETCV